MTEPSVEVGSLDPVAAFEQTLLDMVRVVELFAEDDSPMSAEDFLHAARAAGERLKAVSVFTLSGIMQPIAHKISLDDRQLYEDQVAREELDMDEHDQQMRMLKALRSLVTRFPRDM